MRNQNFADGYLGTGQSPMATSLQKGIDPMFSPVSVLDQYIAKPTVKLPTLNVTPNATVGSTAQGGQVMPV